MRLAETSPKEVKNPNKDKKLSELMTEMVEVTTAPKRFHTVPVRVNGLAHVEL